MVTYLNLITYYVDILGRYYGDIFGIICSYIDTGGDLFIIIYMHIYILCVYTYF